jgi:iron complex outermembrane receptor protein
MMGEIALGKARLFLNAENVFGKRQTQYDPLVRPSRAADGRWTVDAWGPLEGFVLNGGIRLKFGG